MYHNWYEQYRVAKQVQKDLYRQADEARLGDAARKSRKEEKKHARQSKPATTTIFNASATFVLQRNEVISIRVHRRPYRITCVAGRLWTTTDGSPADTILIGGETIAYCKKGKIVVQSLRTSTVRVECPNQLRIVVGSAPQPGKNILVFGGSRFATSLLGASKN